MQRQLQAELAGDVGQHREILLDVLATYPAEQRELEARAKLTGEFRDGPGAGGLDGIDDLLADRGFERRDLFLRPAEEHRIAALELGVRAGERQRGAGNLNRLVLVDVADRAGWRRSGRRHLCPSARSWTAGIARESTWSRCTRATCSA